MPFLDPQVLIISLGNTPIPNYLLASYPGLFDFVRSDDALYADPQVVDFIAVAAA